MGHLLGAEKEFFLIFLIRDFDAATRAGVSVESWRSVVPRSPWARSWTVLYTRKRLHCMRRRFQHISANSLGTAAH